MDCSAARVPSLPSSETHRMNTVPPLSPEEENTFSPSACSPNRTVKDRADDLRWGQHTHCQRLFVHEVNNTNIHIYTTCFRNTSWAVFLAEEFQIGEDFVRNQSGVFFYVNYLFCVLLWPALSVIDLFKCSLDLKISVISWPDLQNSITVFYLRSHSDHNEKALYSSAVIVLRIQPHHHRPELIIPIRNNVPLWPDFPETHTHSSFVILLQHELMCPTEHHRTRQVWQRKLISC